MTYFIFWVIVILALAISIGYYVFERWLEPWEDEHEYFGDLDD